MPVLSPLLFSIWSRGVQIIKLQSYYAFIYWSVELQTFKVVFLEYSIKKEIQFVNADFILFIFCFVFVATTPSGRGPSHLDHTQRHTTVGRTPLDEWSVRRRDLYLTSHNTTDNHAPGGIQTPNLSRQAAADLRLRLRGHWDRLCWTLP